MSGPVNTTTRQIAEATAAVVELSAEGWQWMLLHTTVRVRGGGSPIDAALRTAVATRGVACDVWLTAYDSAPDAARQSLTHSVMASAAGSAWAPALQAVLTAARAAGKPRDDTFDTPLRAFVTATRQRPSDEAPLPDAEVVRLFQALQRCGAFASAERRAMARAVYCSAFESPRAFGLLIADPNADTALHGLTRCSAGDAHKPPRHNSVKCDVKEVTLHDVMEVAAAYDPAVFRAFSDARLPFGARAMAEEWAYELTGPCGCAGAQRIGDSPLDCAIENCSDEAGEWSAARLPSKRLNIRDVTQNDRTPLLAALCSRTPLPRTVAALLSRVPDVDLALSVKSAHGSGGDTAAEWIAHAPPQWLPPHLAAELNLKTQQFGAQYLPSAAVLCAEALQSLCGGVSVPRELVSLVLQYTALPQPNPWPIAHADASADGASAAAPTSAAAAALS